MEQPEPSGAAEGAEVEVATHPFFESWVGVIVVFGVLTVIVAAFVGTGRRTTAEPVASGPPATSVEIGAPIDPAASGADLARCDDPGRTAEEPTGDKIVIGSSVPQSGIYSSYGNIAKGWEAFFEETNVNGGVDGKQLDLAVKDDGYDPAVTKANVDELIRRDEVFALFNIVGDANNLGVRADLGRSCVPGLFGAGNAAALGTPARFPWLIGSSPTYAIEAAVFAGNLGKTKPTAKVGILRLNDELGLNYANSLRKAVASTGLQIASEQTIDIGQGDAQSQVTKLKAAGVDTVFLAVSGPTCVSALHTLASTPSFTPTTFVAAPCTTRRLMGLAGPDAQGVLSATFVKDPGDPRWANDEAMKKYKDVASARGVSDDDIDDPAVAYGWTMGDLLVQTLEAAPSLSRRDVMRAAYSLKNVTPGLLLPGLSVNTNSIYDPYPIEGMAISRWNGRAFIMQGDVLNYEGRTNDFVAPAK